MDDERDDTSQLISVKRCRELLGEEADNLSDHEVDQLRQNANALAHVIIDLFLEQRSTPE
jgi:hypothetical protein